MLTLTFLCVRSLWHTLVNVVSIGLLFLFLIHLVLSFFPPFSVGGTSLLESPTPKSLSSSSSTSMLPSSLDCPLHKYDITHFDAKKEIWGSASGGNMLWGGSPAYRVKSIRSKKKDWNINLNPINRIAFSSRAEDSKSSCDRFKSAMKINKDNVSEMAGIARLVEQRTQNPRITGSLWGSLWNEAWNGATTMYGFSRREELRWSPRTARIPRVNRKLDLH